MADELERIWKEAIVGTIPEFAWRDWKVSQETLVRIGGYPVEIRTEHLRIQI
jgi:hypothetical protein